MKTFNDLMEVETKTKLPDLPKVKKPAQAKTQGREPIPGLGTEVVETDKVKTIAEASLIKPKPIKDSEDAELYVDGIEDCIDSALSYIEEPSFFKFCTATDKNFGVQLFKHVALLHTAIRNAKKEINEVRVQLENAE